MMPIDVIQVPPERGIRGQDAYQVLQAMLVGETEYTPRFFSDAVAIADDGITRFPSGVNDDDGLKNKTPHPMLVRSISFSNVGSGIRFLVGTQKAGGHSQWWHSPRTQLQPGISNSIPMNRQRGATGNPGGRTGNYQFMVPLWKPYRFRPGQSLRVYARSGVSGVLDHALHGIGAVTGKTYCLSDHQAAAAEAEKTHENIYGEDIWITSITANGAAAVSILVEPSDGAPWMKKRAKMNQIGSFFWSRITFDFLPGGVYVLEPNEGFVVDIYGKGSDPYDGGATFQTLSLGIEAYALREG